MSSPTELAVAERTQPSSAPSSTLEVFDRRDAAYARLRALVAVAGTLYASFGAAPAERTQLLVALALFVAYSGALYAAAWRRALPRHTHLYIGLFACDFVLTGSLMIITGGAHSPFYRALYLWVAVLAFYFGRRAGTIGSVASLMLFVALHAHEGFIGHMWIIAMQAAGMLLHGPLIGSLVDAERRRAQTLADQAAELRKAHDELGKAHARLAEEQAKQLQAEKLSAIGLLASGVAHEINNPLGGIMACLRALRENKVPETDRATYWETVADGLDRIRLTVQGLLDFSRQRIPTFAEVDAGEVCEACVRLVAPTLRAKDITIEQNIARGALTLRADRAQLMQALVNILMNAAHAAPRRGHVRIEAQSRRGTCCVGLRVTDDGPGIPRHLVAKVCDPFFTTKMDGSGTGLGLSVTLGIVRAHGGELQIESEEGRGARVTIWLPSREEIRDA